MLADRHPSKRTGLALGAVHAALTALASLPDSAEKQRLLGEAESCARAVHSWVDRAPSDPEREAMMKRVLALHVAVATLQREKPTPAIPSGLDSGQPCAERPTDIPPFDPDEYASDSEARLRILPPSSESDVTTERMRDAFERGELEEALSLARSLLDAVPLHADARLIAAKCTEALEQTYQGELGPMTCAPVLAVSVDELHRFTLDDTALQLVHFIDGATPTASVLQRSGLPRLVALRCLASLYRRGIVSSR